MHIIIIIILYIIKYHLLLLYLYIIYKQSNQTISQTESAIDLIALSHALVGNRRVKCFLLVHGEYNYFPKLHENSC